MSLQQISLLFLAVFSLSQASIFAKLSGTPPEALGFWRLLIAGLCLFPFALTKGQLLKSGHSLKTFLPSTLLSGFFLFAHLWTYKFAAQHTFIANLMILFAMNPLFTAIGNWVFFKQKPTARLGIAYIFALSGVWMLVRHSFEFTPERFVGDCVALVSGLMYSAYMLAGKKSRQYISNWTFTSLIYLSAGACFFITAGIRGIPLNDISLKGIACIVALIFIPTFMGHANFTYLMGKVDLNLISCAKLMEPLLSSITAYFVFQESLGSEAFMSFILISFAILILFAPQPQFFKKGL